VKARFSAELIEGHQGVTAVIVPFDPQAVLKTDPVALAGRRTGWLVKGTANGVRFEGYIGQRWGNYFILVDRELRSAAKVSIGDTLKLVVEPTATAKALAKATEQSLATTQPGRGSRTRRAGSARAPRR
jgi:hypothetical protein